MIDAAVLTADLRRLVLDLEEDLRARVDGPDRDLRDAGKEESWRAEYQAALAAERTSATWTQWRDERVTQAAVAWVLTTVFVRFCEDNRLLAPVWLAGPEGRRAEAADAYTAYFRAHPTHTDREWLLQPVEYLKGVRATRDLVAEDSPLWLVSPSGGAAQRVREFWQATDGAGNLLRDFTDAELGTRFLGDLYQDLSEHAREQYALLQTPVFVEEFILDRTLEPALRERPLEGFRLIDPTCGSGHFLLGAFHRLLDRWQRAEPAVPRAELARRALGSVHGVDINPFAVAIARFRLIIAALHAIQESSLEHAPDWPLHLATGDSLLHGREQAAFELGGAFDEDAVVSGFTYVTEDRNRLDALLTPGQYDVVLGNPPYITVKDKKLNAAYRQRYSACKGKYALTAPFMQRFFALAKPGSDAAPAGWTGQITSNSFMKREFGSKLIEDFLPRKDLRLVADTSGAYIPGHGTPTVIVVGKNQTPVADVVRAVLGIRGEPGRPADAANGQVWRSIVDHVDLVGHEDEFTSTADVDRKILSMHPWSLTGGVATEVSALIGQARIAAVGECVDSIGFAAITGEDAVYCGGGQMCQEWTRKGLPVRQFIEGDGIRDYQGTASRILFPYNVPSDIDPGRLPAFWPYRTNLRAGLAFQQTREERGIPWYQFILPNMRRLGAETLIAFAEVATHNHFVLDRGGKVFKQTAPVIKLPEGATEDDHIALLGVLNSSTACFWLRQNCYPKGGDPMGKDGARVAQVPWADRYQFNASNVEELPLPGALPLERARSLDSLATRQGDFFAAAFAAASVPTADSVAAAQAEWSLIRGQMIAQQEELDWEVYRLYGLLTEDLTLPEGAPLPELALGERAFEIVLARRCATGAESTAWFERHGSTPVTEVPAHWPAAYRELVERRLAVIGSNKLIALLEKPEYKRRWATEPWDRRVTAALRDWLLDRLEDRRYWFDKHGRPQPLSVAQLADQVARDPDMVSVLGLWSGQRDVDVAKVLATLLEPEGVPYLAAYRYKEPGLRKRREWENVWELQRAEDRGETVGTIPVPPKYTSGDFRKSSYWSHRGKLDVPKERFISYPGGGRATDPTTVLGWAGWDHAEQAVALVGLIHARQQDGAEDAVLLPLVAGLEELEPWVRQWHDSLDQYGQNTADTVAEILRGHLASLGVTREDLHAWRPATTTRARTRKDG